jgi:hypothetical protein
VGLRQLGVPGHDTRSTPAASLHPLTAADGEAHSWLEGGQKEEATCSVVCLEGVCIHLHASFETATLSSSSCVSTAAPPMHQYTYC